MRRLKSSGLLWIVLLAATVLGVGGCYTTEKYERTVEMSNSFEPGHQFNTKTHNGYIRIKGTETNQCSVTAKISGWGNSIERAQELCEAVKVRFENVDGNLTLVSDKPITSGNEGTGVALDITLPVSTGLGLGTHNGEVRINNTAGDVKAETHNGQITIENLDGNIDVLTHNGAVRCRQVVGNSKLRTHNGEIRMDFAQGTQTGANCYAETHNGSVNISYPDGSENPVDVKAVTHNGSVNFNPPANYSASVTANTHNGSIHSHLPVTVVGEINKRKLNGTIGTGQGKLHLETHNGSITIHE